MAKDDPRSPDPHFDYKHDILKNVPGLTDKTRLDKFERIETAKSILNLQINPVRGRFDSAHLKAIHFRIFQNVYPWAGEFRHVNMSRSASYPFGAVQFLEKNLDATLDKLASENT